MKISFVDVSPGQRFVAVDSNAIILPSLDINPQFCHIFEVLPPVTQLEVLDTKNGVVEPPV